MDAYSFLSLACCETFCKDMSAKNKIINKAMRFYTENTPEPLNRFTLGLNRTSLSDKIKSAPNAFKKLFIDEGAVRITGANIEALFEPKLSSTGSNERIVENVVVTWWRDYILAVEDGDCECSLEDLLIFATGADKIPPLGFSPQPSLEFTNKSQFPLANSCCNIITIPLGHEDYDMFKWKMEFGIHNSPGFGVA